MRLGRVQPATCTVIKLQGVVVNMGLYACIQYTLQPWPHDAVPLHLPTVITLYVYIHVGLPKAWETTPCKATTSSTTNIMAIDAS